MICHFVVYETKFFRRRGKKIYCRILIGMQNERMNEKQGENTRKCNKIRAASVVSNVESFVVIFTYRLMKIVLCIYVCVCSLH